jgi:hypothetical protein
MVRQPTRILTKKTISDMPILNLTKLNRIFKHIKFQRVSSKINTPPVRGNSLSHREVAGYSPVP